MKFQNQAYSFCHGNIFNMLYKFCTQHLIFHSGSPYADSAVTFCSPKAMNSNPVVCSWCCHRVQNRWEEKFGYMANFFVCSLCVAVTAGSYLQGFVILYWTFSNGWPGADRERWSADGAGARLGTTGTSAVWGWHSPSCPPQVRCRGYLEKPPTPCQANPPQLLCGSTGWAGGRSRGQGEEGQITSDRSCGDLSTCMGNFHLLNLITLVLGNKSF